MAMRNTLNKDELMQKMGWSKSSYYRKLQLGMPSINDGKKEFILEDVKTWDENLKKGTTMNLIVGHEYTNEDIMARFKVAGQGGMRKSLGTNALVLISNHWDKNNTYEDVWNGDVFLYTGMGQKGDQTLLRGQNKTLAESNHSDIQVVLFEVFSPGQYVYIGHVQLIGDPYTVEEPDADGNLRKVYKFPLKVKDPSSAIPVEILEKFEKKNEKEILKKLNKDGLWEKAQERSNANLELEKKVSQITTGDSNTNVQLNYRLTIQKTYKRDPFIAEYVKQKANGYCQLCGEKAPFEVDGKPYLEAHHIKWLSNGGLDTIANQCALCPNCHAKVHNLNPKYYEKELMDKVAKDLI